MELLPLLRRLLVGLQKQMLSVSTPALRNLYAELCLTLPVRLSALLPFLRHVVRSVLVALQSETELVGNGIRMLELCVDTLSSSFLAPILIEVREELLRSLWCLLKPDPSNSAPASATPAASNPVPASPASLSATAAMVSTIGIASASLDGTQPNPLVLDQGYGAAAAILLGKLSALDRLFDDGPEWLQWSPALPSSATSHLHLALASSTSHRFMLPLDASVECFESVLQTALLSESSLLAAFRGAQAVLLGLLQRTTHDLREVPETRPFFKERRKIDVTHAFPHQGLGGRRAGRRRHS
jgi:hypothetical protein